MEFEENYDLIVRLAPLITGPFKERRRKVHQCLILAAIAEIDDAFSVDDVRRKIRDLMRMDLDSSIVISVLSDLEKEGLVENTGIGYKIKRKPELPTIDNIIEPIWKDFVRYLKERHVEIDVYLDKDVKEFFENALIRLYLKFVDMMKIDRDQIETLPLEKSNLNQIADSLGLSKRFTDYFIDYIKSNSKILLDSVYSIYGGLINIELIFREKELKDLSEKFLKQDMQRFFKFFILDTCVLTALLCKTDRIHNLAAYTIKSLKKFGIPLYYTQRTREEMWNFIKGSDKEIKSRKVKPSPIIRSQLVADFIKRGNMLWDEYYAYIRTWENILKRDFGIVPLPDDFTHLSLDGEIYEYAKTTLPVLDRLRAEQSELEFYRERSEVTIEHDAYCLSLVSALRSEMDSGPWFLTFDNLSSAIDSLYAKKHGTEFGLVIHPRTLLNYFVVFTGAEYDEAEKEKIAEVILRYTIDYGEEIDIEAFARLFVNKVEGLTEKDSELIRELFVKSPLRNELEQALEENRGDIAEEIAIKIITNENIVNKIIQERENRERIKELARKVKVLTDELKKEKAAREALEKAIRNVKINVSVTTKIDVSIRNQLEGLVKILEGEGVFESGIIERPDLSTKEKIVDWLKKLEKIIKSSKEVGDVLKSLLPVVSALLSKLN